MPDWLKEAQVEFVPSKKETFLMKNQKGLLFILQKFTASAHVKSRFSNIHPALRLLDLLAVILLVSLMKSLLVLWLVGIYLLCLLLLLSAGELRGVLKRAFALVLMPLLLYLPMLFFQGSNPLFLLRLPLIGLAVSLFISSTNVYELLRTLKSCHFPNIVLLQLDITIKYIFVFGNLLLKMLLAVRARAVGNELRFSLGSNLFGIIYLKALAYGEALGHAMEARCFNGEYYQLKQPFNKRDRLFVLVHSLLFIALIILGG